VNREAVRAAVDRQVSLEELRGALLDPIGGDERDEVLSLVRWFCRRYPTGAERLAYVRQAYARWQRHAHRDGPEDREPDM
jgi:hypothetical protein